VAGEISTIRAVDGEIRPVIVTSTSLPFAILVILAFELMGRLGWAAVKPSVVISCEALPRCSNGVLDCAMQRPVVKTNASIASITRLILCLLPLPRQISRIKFTLPLIIIHTKKNTRFLEILLKKKRAQGRELYIEENGGLIDTISSILYILVNLWQSGYLTRYFISWHYLKK
jgi:hypothetical protein